MTDIQVGPCQYCHGEVVVTISEEDAATWAQSPSGTWPGDPSVLTELRTGDHAECRRLLETIVGLTRQRQDSPAPGDDGAGRSLTREWHGAIRAATGVGVAPSAVAVAANVTPAQLFQITSPRRAAWDAMNVALDAHDRAAPEQRRAAALAYLAAWDAWAATILTPQSEEQ